MNDLIVTDQPVPNFPPINLEDPNMVNAFVQYLGNTFTAASNLAQQVAQLRQDQMELRRQVGAANHSREVADAAYNAVNAQRIQAENDANSLRRELETRTTNYNTLHEVNVGLQDRITELEAEMSRRESHYQEMLDTSRQARVEAEEKAHDFEELYNMAVQDTETVNRALKEAKDSEGAARQLYHEIAKRNEELQTAMESITRALANTPWAVKLPEPAPSIEPIEPVQEPSLEPSPVGPKTVEEVAAEAHRSYWNDPLTSNSSH